MIWNSEPAVDQVREAIRARVLKSGDIDACASAVFAEVPHDDYRILARTWIHQEAGRLRREAVRDLERAEDRRERDAYRNTQEYKDAAVRDRERRKALAQKSGFDTIGAHEAYENSSEGREARMERYHAQTRTAMAYISAACDFTESFLQSEFALGDGRKVTWGDATVEEHRERIDYMIKKVEGIENDVLLHLRVVEILIECGKSTLREAALVSAEPQAENVL